MTHSLVDLIQLVRLAASHSQGIIEPDLARAVVERANLLSSRVGHLGEILVVALIGGTGSGKSSLFNAIAGEPLAGVSILRPYTQSPMAWIPHSSMSSVKGVLGDLGVERWVGQDALDSVGLIDMPDVDSTAEWHRGIVDKLIPHVDAILWVFDPEKYSDESLHQDFLRPLTPYADQLLFVVNKMDTVGLADRSGLVSDVVERLEVDGFESPLVFAVAAAPMDGQPRGVDAVVDHFKFRVDVKRVAIGKFVGDVRAFLHDLGNETGVWHGSSVALEERLGAVSTALLAELVGGEGSATAESGFGMVEDLIAAIAAEVGPTVGVRVLDRFPPGEVSLKLDEALVEARVASGVDTERYRASFEEVVSRPLRSLLWDRAKFAASLTAAAVAGQSVEHNLKRLLPSS